MALNYVVSAQKSTAVVAAVSCSFCSSDELNLVVAKTSRLELFRVAAEGLKAVKNDWVFGRIQVLKAFRPVGENRDCLFALTGKYQVMVLQWGADEKIATRAYGNLADRIGRPSETGMLAVHIPNTNYFGVRLYDGLLKVVQFESANSELVAFNLRFEELSVIDLCFLHGCDVPTIAYVYNDQNGRHLKTATILMDEREFGPGPWRQDNIEAEAALLLPLPSPLGGVAVVGQATVTYHKDEGEHVAVAPVHMQQATVICAAPIDADGSRWLLADMAGRLFLCMFDCEQPMDGDAAVRDIKVESLGETSLAECLCYLDNGVVFVGSRMADSQLVRVVAAPADDGAFVQVLESFTNLAPILDMAVVNVDGQSQLVTCSGAFKVPCARLLRRRSGALEEGSLRVIRSGIGIEEHASVDLAGIKGLWSARFCSDAFDNLLVVSFVGHSRLLLLDGEELEETDIAGVDTDQQTVWAGNVFAAGRTRLLHVTALAIRLIDAESKAAMPLAEWSAPADKRISLVACNPSTGQIVVASARHIFYLELTQGPAGDVIQLQASVELAFEAACVDITPISDDGRSSVCAVGLWTDISVRLLALPSLAELVVEPLGGEIMPRSLLMARLEGQLYLLVALGDGNLFYYQMDTTTGALVERKRVTLGTQPVTLRPFRSLDGAANVFACSDRPTVIYSTSHKLVFSNVNVKLVAHMSPLNAAAYPHSLAMSDGHTLVIGSSVFTAC